MNYYTPKPTSTFNPPPGFDFDGMESRPLRRPPCEHCWIPVSERLPEEGVPVLVWFNSPCTCMRPYAEVTILGLANTWQHSNQFDRVTHWMPLPEPPEIR